jgi:hypothetical protein
MTFEPFALIVRAWIAMLMLGMAADYLNHEALALSYFETFFLVLFVAVLTWRLPDDDDK